RSASTGSLVFARSAAATAIMPTGRAAKARRLSCAAIFASRREYRQSGKTMFGWIRVVATLTLVLVVTLPLALAQIFVMRTGWGSDRALPRLWHRFILRILDFRLTIHGRMASERPLMLASNHISWTDIMVVGAAADINFVAKSEVSGWPMIGTLAHLQRTIFVEREKRGKSG